MMIMTQTSYCNEIIAKSSGETLCNHTKKCIDNILIISCAFPRLSAYTGFFSFS